jgi:Chromatin remodelling complex Rsc7/Swp82 subunit
MFFTDPVPPGREFKAQTFTLPTRHPTRLYMLAIDAARTSGFRDSLYYFRKNPLAIKLNANQGKHLHGKSLDRKNLMRFVTAEKEYLIAEGKLGSHLRTRYVFTKLVSRVPPLLFPFLRLCILHLGNTSLLAFTWRSQC